MGTQTSCRFKFFYNGLTNAIKSILDAFVGGSIFGMTNQPTHTLLEDLANTSYNWPCEMVYTPEAAGIYQLN